MSLARRGSTGRCWRWRSLKDARGRGGGTPCPVIGKLDVAAIDTPHVLLSAVGQREEALAAAEAAVTIRRELAEARPDAFRAHLT